LKVRCHNHIILALYATAALLTPSLEIHAVTSQILPFLRFRYQNYNLDQRMKDTLSRIVLIQRRFRTKLGYLEERKK
jgi:hypothetical protein